MIMLANHSSILDKYTKFTLNKNSKNILFLSTNKLIGYDFSTPNFTKIHLHHETMVNSKHHICT